MWYCYINWKVKNIKHMSVYSNHYSYPLLDWNICFKNTCGQLSVVAYMCLLVTLSGALNNSLPSFPQSPQISKKLLSMCASKGAAWCSYWRAFNGGWFLGGAVWCQWTPPRQGALVLRFSLRTISFWRTEMASAVSALSPRLAHHQW